MKNVINYFLLIFILIFAAFFTLEVSLRIYLTLKHFETPHLNYWGKTWYRFEKIEFAGFHEELISDLIVSNYQKVNGARWKKNSKLTINHNGFRENGNEISNYKNEKKILVTGDSFAFGDQVSNNETWPAYLENKSKILVFNGGHPGYSAGQSLKKAIILSNKDTYDYFIWSVIYDDFIRDYQLKFIVKKNGELKFNKFKKNKDFKREKKKKLLYHYLKENFFIVYIVDRELISKIIKPEKKISPKSYKRLVKGLINYSEKELSDFLINKFLKINIDKKYILIQHTGQSDNTSEKLRSARYEQIEKKYSKILLDTAMKHRIKILDTKLVFENMPADEKRLMWFDHHTPLGNQKVSDFIFKNINF